MGHGGLDDLERSKHSRSRRRRQSAAPGSTTSTNGLDISLKDIEGGPPASDPLTKTLTDSKQPLPSTPPYLWTSANAEFENGEFRFSGFEPCYIACIKDVEWQIRRKIQTIDLASEDANDGLAGHMAPLLLRYSQLIDALEGIESADRVYEEDGLGSRDRFDLLTRYSGERRRIWRPAGDRDRVHDALQQNWILVVLGYVYKWDAANSLKRRFGNVTATLDRVLIGLAGGAMLLVPMIMMVFLKTRAARLTIVSVATMLFALGVSLMSVSREGVVASTAAYAAVMVVYIGGSEGT